MLESQRALDAIHDAMVASVKKIEEGRTPFPTEPREVFTLLSQPVIEEKNQLPAYVVMFAVVMEDATLAERVESGLDRLAQRL